MNNAMQKKYPLFLLLYLLPFWGFTQYIGNSPYCPENGGLIINEISNGAAGSANQEYIELLVLAPQNTPNARVDISGWIIDDNNVSSSGQGTAQGHLKFGDCYNALTAGDLLVIYNADDRNPSLPADDPTDANGDGVYIIPHTSDCIDACNSNPSPTTNNSDYCPCTDATSNLPNWPIGMRNAGDVLQVRDRCANVVHAIDWGEIERTPEVNDAPTRLHFEEAQAGRVLSFNDTDWNDINNWNSIDFSGNETPGRPNNTANTFFVAAARTVGINCNGTIEDCSDADAGDLLFPSGYNTTPINICRGDDLLAFASDYTQTDESEPSTAEYAYILTVTSPPYLIIDFNTTGDFDLTDATGNRYFVWGFSYINTANTTDVLDFLTNEVISIRAIEDYTACGFFKDVDNLTINGDRMEITIAAPPEVLPLEFELCEEENGQLSFILPEIANFVAYEQDSVLWYTDATSNTRIDDNTPFVTGDNLIFAEAYLGGCAAEPVPILIDVIENPIVQLDLMSVSCNGANDSAVRLDITGERAPYFVNWIYDDWDGQTNITGLPSGPYEITIVDANNSCRTILNFEITEPDLIRLDCFGATAATPGMSDAIFSFKIEGGSPPYNLSWGAGLEMRQGNAGENAITGLSPGDYPFLVTDVNGCTQECQFTVEGDNCINTALIEELLCPNEQIIINSTIYNRANPTGSIFIPSNVMGSCDSLISVNLQFREEATRTFDANLCPVGSRIINGTRYDINNPSGTERLLSTTGCDSTIFINLGFTATDSTYLQETLCIEESLLINGTVYNAANTSGIEVFEIANSACDSVVVIDLSFVPLPNLVIDTILCNEGFIELNGRRYDRSNPSGTQVLSNGSASGCDSIININLNFAEPIVADYTPTLCAGDSLVINGNVYNTATPTGTEVLLAASQFGCDSTINIVLQFSEEIMGTLQETRCAGESLLINGTRYDETNPSGIERLIASSQSGCDSLLQIDLNFLAEARFNFTQNLCFGDEIIINGTAYNETNPSGTERLLGASSMGCDSILAISLSFSDILSSSIELLLCQGESLQVGEQLFDESKPSGTVLFPSTNATDCDSLVSVSLQFEAQDSSFIRQTLCSDEEIIVNGRSYNINNPTGMERIASAMGCDSLVFITLDFNNAFTTNVTSQDPTCTETSDGTILIENIVGGTSPYTLFLEGDSKIDSSFPIRFSNLSAGQYLLEIEDANGCIKTENITLTPAEELYVRLGEDLLIGLGDSIQLAAEVSPNVVEWEWSTNEFLSNPSGLRTIARPNRTLFYTLTVYDEAGCSASDEIRIRVNLERTIFIPTAFSPNADGQNDFFTIYGDNKVVNIQNFQIFDRWGNLVFENTDFLPNTPEAGWDGRSKGQLLHTGTYTYFASIEFSDGKTEVFSGTVALLL